MATTSQLHGSHELFTTPRHLKVTGVEPAFGFEPCEDVGCLVGTDGRASSCHRIACPACGCGGTNLSMVELVDVLTEFAVSCSCGYSWVRSEQLVSRP